MVFYKRFVYDTVTNPWHSPSWYVPKSKRRLVITPLSSFPLTPVFRSCLSASAAALAFAHVSGRHRGPGLEGAHALPGLLSHCLGSPALHGWAAAREACLLAFCLAMRVRFGGPSAVEALVGWGGLYSLISSVFLWVTCLALTWLLMAFEPEPEPLWWMMPSLFDIVASLCVAMYMCLCVWEGRYIYKSVFYVRVFAGLMAAHNC